MKNTKRFVAVVLLLSLLLAACGAKGHSCANICGTCGKCTDAACTEAACQEKCTCADADQLCTLTGLVTDNYSFAAEGQSIRSDGSLQAAPGTQLKLTLTLGERYCVGEPTVKVGDTVLTAAADGSYAFTLDSDAAIALEGVLFYEVVSKNPFSIKAESTQTEDLGSPMSEVSNVIKADWQKEGYTFANIHLNAYHRVVFFAKAENAWISFKDRLGVFNKKNTAIYGNGVKNAETGEMEPDSVWHRFEFVRETDDEGNRSYALYVDGQKHTHYDENTPVDARLSDKLNDFVLDLNGAYYVSELLGCKDPMYAVDNPDYYIVEQTPFDMEADGLLTEEYPCEESVRYNLWYKPQWSQEKPANFPLEPYAAAKFYINTPAGGWIVCQVETEDVQTFEPGSGWHEFIVQSNGAGYNLIVDGQDTGRTLRSNLRELTFLLNDDTYYVSELFVLDDPNFDGVIDEPYYQEPAAPDLYGTGRLPAGTVSVLDNPFAISGKPGGTPMTGFDVSNKLNTTWNKYNFNNLELGPYKSVMFAVKTKGWYGMMVGNEVLTEIQGSDSWRLIRLTRISGNRWKLYYGATPMQTLTLPNDNMTDLSFRFGTDTYYVTDLRAIEDPSYVPPQYVKVTSKDPLGLGAAVSDETPGNYFVTGSYAFTPAQWSKGTFAQMDVLAYEDLRFFVKAAGIEGKFASMDKGDSQILAAQDDSWHEIRIRKVNGAMKVYVDGLEKTTLNDMSQLSVMFNEGATYHYTDIYGLPDDGYAPVTVKLQAPVGCAVEFRLHKADEDGILRVEAGTALYFEIKLAGGYEGTPVVKVNGQTLTDVYGLYTYVADQDATITVEGITKIPDGYDIISDLPFDLTGTAASGQVADGFQNNTRLTINWTADGVPFKAVNLKNYSKVKFAIQSVAWHGIGLGGETLADSSGDVWREVRLERNGDKWDIYYSGELKKTVTLPNNKLSDLIFLTGGESTYYVSELRGIGEPQQEIKYDFIADGLLGAGTKADNAPENYEKSTKVTVGWSAEGKTFAGQNLAPYTEVRFAVQSVAWHGIGLGSATLAEHSGNAWNEIRLVKNGAGWDFYYGGELKKTVTLPNNNLSDLKLLTGGNDTYYVTELRGIADDSFVDEYLFVADSLLGPGTEADNAHGDYEQSTKVTIGWSAEGKTFAGQSLIGYSEVKFVVMSDAWHGIGLGSTTLADSNNQMWNEIRLVKNGSDWDFYYGGALKKTVTLPNDNLSDLKLLTGGKDTYYISELRGKKGQAEEEKPATAYVQVKANFINNTPSSTTADDLPSKDVSVVNITNCGWISPGVADGITLSKYTELKFYYKVSESGKWFEMYGPGGATVYQGNATAWTEIKFLQEGETWTLYVNGTGTKYGLAGATLKDIVATLTLGGSVTADVYVTDLVGLLAKEPETPAAGYKVVSANFISTTPTGTATDGLPSQEAHTVNIFHCGWISPGVVDGIDLSGYTELKFWYKVSESGKWFEMYGPGGATVYQGNATAWTEMKFLQEGETWTLYVNGTGTKYGLAGATLKDIVATLTLGGSVEADVYVTDLIGKPV